MNEVELPLSVGNVKKLIRNLREFSKEFEYGGEISTEVGKAYANSVKSELVQRIASIPDVDGNYLGTENAAESVFVLPEIAASGFRVLWIGRQIVYVEFGTGARGASGVYPYPEAMAAANYHPDPLKKVWWYPDRKGGDPIISFGLAPQSPMGSTALMAEVRGLPPEAIQKVNEAVARAFSV